LFFFFLYNATFYFAYLLQDVIFTDESKIEVCTMSKRSYRKKGVPVKGVPKAKHPYSVMVWGGISKKGATKLLLFNGIMKSEFYQENILSLGLKPFIEDRYPDEHRFMQDNDPKHTSRSTKQFMEDNGISWWPTPAESPDLNPIEMLWHEMKVFISKTVKPKTKDELDLSRNAPVAFLLRQRLMNIQILVEWLSCPARKALEPWIR
jgi:hypothetical protein